MAKGRQIYLQEEEIERLAYLVSNDLECNSDDQYQAEQYGEDITEYVERTKLLRNLLRKLWYYG